MAGVADKGAKRLALGIEKLHRRVLVQTVADALKREVHRPILKKYPSSRSPPVAQTRYEKPAKQNLNKKEGMQKSRSNESDGRISGFEGLRGLRILGF